MSLKLRLHTIATGSSDHVVEVQKYSSYNGAGRWHTLDSGPLADMQTKWPRAKFRNKREKHLNKLDKTTAEGAEDGLASKSGDPSTDLG